MARTFEKLKCESKEGIEINIRAVVFEDGTVSSSVCNVV
jgi:hypothetical protein